MFFISVPITSFPYFPPSFGGNSAVVRPLLVYPLLVLLILITLPRLLTTNLSKPSLILFLFLLSASISSIFPYIHGVESPWREVSVLSREVRTFITLGLAVAIYLTTALIPREPADLQFSMRWLYTGLSITSFWGSLQAINILDIIPGWFKLLNQLQGYISIKGLNPTRISGMTYEPSWFADQIVVIWLPFILAASISDFSVFKFRYKWLTVEKILLVWTLIILAFTLSRTGLVIGIGLIVFAVLLKLVDFYLSKPSGQMSQTGEGSNHKKEGFFRTNKGRLVIIVFAILVFIVLFYAIGSQSKYISRIWEFWLQPGKRGVRKYLDYIGFGARITYWEAAFNIYKSHPVFGVGLGNYTIYYPDMLPYQHLARIPELLRHVVPQESRSRVLTAKHFLLRILAETGLVGTGIFLTFLLVITFGAFNMWFSDEKDEYFWGTAGLLGVASFFLDTFSYDSLAIPNPWIMLGVITAATRVFTTVKKGDSQI